MNLKDFCLQHNFTLKDKIDFEWDRYWDGIPSVTTILKLIEDPWFEYVKRAYPQEVEKACDNGKIVHKDAEDFFKRNWSSYEVSPQIMKFHVLYDITPIHFEERFIKDGIQGSIDIIWNVGRLNKDMNIDYKNTQMHSVKYFVQLMWYKYLNGLDWLLVYAGKWKLKVIEVPNEYFQVFVELRELFFKLKDFDNNNSQEK